MKNETCPSCGQEVAPFEPGAIVEYVPSPGARNRVIGVIVTPALNVVMSSRYGAVPKGYERFVAILGGITGDSYTIKRTELRQLHGYLHID